MSNPHLTVSYGGRARRFPYPSTPKTLGSAPSTDWLAPFPGVSGHHAIVYPEPGGIRVVDTGSKNGLVIAGERVNEVILRPGQILRLGRASLSLQEGDPEEDSLALRLHPTDSTESIELFERQSSTGDGGSPARALRLFRELWSKKNLTPAERTNFLCEAQIITGASSLLALTTSAGGEPIVTDCSGELISTHTLALVASHLERVANGCCKSVLVGVKPTASALLAVPAFKTPLVALFEGAPSQLQSWYSDFLLHLAERLCTDRYEPRSSAQEQSTGSVGRLMPPPGMVLGASPGVRDLLDQIRAATATDLNVLLIGETGTGKELFARMIHASGTHASGSFVPINCAAIPSELFEAELFGITAGVATGVAPRPGLILQAAGGAIFLDEISEMADRLQAKLLRFLQDREILSVGAAKPRPIDVQVISASNMDPALLVRRGQFREDLYYRLRGVEFRIPPLRERREDLPQLIVHFASRAARQCGRRIEGLSRDALELLSHYAWPGNVRELENEITSAVARCTHGGALRRQHFGAVNQRPAEAEEPLHRRKPEERASTRSLESLQSDEETGHAVTQRTFSFDTTLKDLLEEVERQRILHALAEASQNKTKAARRLGVSRNGLTIKMKRLGIQI